MSRVAEWGDGILLVFIPGRRSLGGLAIEVRKRGLQLVEGFPSPALRDRYAGRLGVALTVVGFAPTPAPRGKLCLPELLVEALYGMSADVDAALEIALVDGETDAKRMGRLTIDEVAGPLSTGCRYLVSPPAPNARTVPGRPEIEGWTRRS